MMPKKSPVSYTVLAHSKQHLHNKKRRPRREHRCGADQISSEGQVRTSHNSKVLERGQLCVSSFVRVLGLFIVVNGWLLFLGVEFFPLNMLFAGFEAKTTKLHFGRNSWLVGTSGTFGQNFTQIFFLSKEFSIFLLDH